MLYDMMTGEEVPYPRDLKDFNYQRNKLSGAEYQLVERYLDEWLDKTGPNVHIQVSTLAPKYWEEVPALMAIYVKVGQRNMEGASAKFLGEWLQLKIIERDTHWILFRQEKHGTTEDFSVNKYWWRPEDKK
jgi:hypothetical protein